MKIAVIGASHAGVSEIQNLLANKPEASIDWFEQEPMAQLMGLKKSEFQIQVNEYKQKNVAIHNQTKIKAINTGSKIITTDKGKEYSYDKLVLAVGSHPNVLSVKGNNLEGIVSLNNSADIMKIRKLTESNEIKNVVIIGGGYIGVGVADLFESKDRKITLIDHNEAPLTNYLDCEFTDILTKELINNEVTISTNNEVQEFIGKNGKISKVITKKSEYSADLVVVSVGVHANTQWLQENLELTRDGHIVTNRYLQTSDPNIFAIGDNVLVPYSLTESKMGIALASNARLQAAIVAQNIFNPSVEMPAVQGTSVWQSSGYFYGSTGLNEHNAKKMDISIKSVVVKQQLAISNKTVPLVFKLVYSPETLRVIGAQLLSKENLTANLNVISLAINQKLTLKDLQFQDFFFYLQAGLNSNFITVAARDGLRQEELL